jgi:hypothetical protein
MSNFLPSLPSIVDDLGSLYSNISQKDLELLNEDSDYYDQEVTEFVEDIICTISTSMIFEGYSAQAVLSFLAKSSEEDIIENYLSIDKVYITESIVSDEYIQEQFEILDEGIGAALRVLGTGLKMGGKGLLKGTGTALKGAGRTILTATKRAVGPGGRKALKTAATKVKDIAGAAIKRVPTIAKAGLLGGAGVLTGYLGAKLGQGDKTETGKPSSGGSTADEIKNHQKYAASKGKYYSSSDGKTYANYNDALAARNSRLGINPSSGGSEGGSNSSGGYDAYDLVLEYLFSQGHVETVEEAHYVMMVMDAETIGTIVEEYENDLLAEEITEWVNELVEGGYDLSEYTWDDLAEYYVNEATIR